MTKLPEIIRLFTKLASHLHQNGEEESSCREAISSLNESLNFNQRSRVRVLDTALSLMCFKSPEICNSTVEYLVDTVVSVLVSSVSCNVTYLDKGELVQIGSSISSVDVPKLIGAVVEVLGGLAGYGMLSHKLLRAVLKVATSASCYQSLFPISSVVCGESSDNIKTIVRKLECNLLEETSVNKHEPPIRLLLWFIDPATLKHDVSKILREAVQRPFLCLKKEFYERMSWRLILICLVTSPTMFIEARALLHNWFLLTGFASIQDLKTELVSSALDLLSRPMWWGMSMELGSMLPFSNAYFPNKHYTLFSTLAGPISCESFLDLVQLIGEPIAHTRKHMNPSMFHPSSHGMIRQTASNLTMIDHKSMWALLMDFPAWFYFSALLLFYEKSFQDIFLSKCSSGAVETEQTHDLELRCSAARYLAWILNPSNETHCGLLVDCITEISDSWKLKHNDFSYQQRTCSDAHPNNDTADCRRKLKTLKIDSSKKDLKAVKELVGPAVGPWLKDFNDHYVNYYNKTVMGNPSSGAKATSVASPQPSLLFRKTLLGILIGCSSNLREDEYELLLHYAATGSIHLPRESPNSEMKHMKQKFEGYNTDGSSSKGFDERDERMGPVAGASLVFNLFDIVEDMAGSMIECENSQLDFICRAKGRASSYLGKCIKKILQLQPGEDEDRVVMLKDLQRRLARWQQQGREVFEGYEAFDDLISALNL